MLRLLLILILTIVSSKALAYYELDPTLKSVYANTLSLELDRADLLLKRENIEKPGNDLVVLYVNNVFFMKAFISEEQNYFEAFKKNSALTLKKLDERQENFSSPWHSYAKAEVMIQEAIVKVKFREYVSAANEIRKAYRLIEKNKVAFPEFPLNNKLSGLLNVIIGSVPREYHWLVEIAGMDGSMATGTDELIKLYSDINGTDFECYQEEILFYLSNIYTIFNYKDVALNSCLELLKKYSSSGPLMKYCAASIYIKLDRNDEAIQCLTNSLDFTNKFPFYFLSYKLGLCKLRKLEHQAENDFNFFLSTFKGKNYIKSCYQKLAWLSYLNNDLSNYQLALEKCRMNGISFIDEDKEAMKEASSGFVINKILLRARLLYDGGYFEKALAELVGKPIDSFPSYRDQLEVSYRLARIYDKLGKSEKAILLFEQTIKNGSSATYYYAANSALILGGIYENRNEFVKAEYYFKICLSLNNHEYQNSIDQKAQAGIDRLKQEIEKQ